MTETKDIFFQAIGIISGQLILNKKPYTLRILDKNYQVFFKNPSIALPAIAKEIHKSGNTLRLLVYPSITYYPGKEEPHKVQFQIVAWESTSDEPKNIFSELNDFEFLLSGFWQFTPVSKTPCVTVFKNYREDRAEDLNFSDVFKRKPILKAIHVPMLWHDSQALPNNDPNATLSDQNKQNYLSIKTRFLPSSDLWEFDSFIV